ncbi:predicted protein [Arabidopsis lyrata subsp. lyrata]|uniref:Predicted protein n=1 Tax=Arabidopsis lyrata subsp. lyrata TaxID=81972 RepID=D7LPL7_ARALL|nr:predicted protein [Arabidopsis lyrata subsp. lyrata]
MAVELIRRFSLILSFPIGFGLENIARNIRYKKNKSRNVIGAGKEARDLVVTGKRRIRRSNTGRSKIHSFTAESTDLETMTEASDSRPRYFSDDPPYPPQISR